MPCGVRSVVVASPDCQQNAADSPVACGVHAVAVRLAAFSAVGAARPVPPAGRAAWR
jgi:hypothetical protein